MRNPRGVVRTVILCGGKGTRAYPHTVDVPKPLLHVDGRPVLRHVMDVFAAQGFRSFVLAAGYRSEMIEEFAKTLDDELDVIVRDTGEETGTGGRILACADDVDDVFFATYADGLGNVDLRALHDFHRGHAGLATVTTVALPSQYGTLELDGDRRVRRFREKPRLPEHRINAGFFAFDRAVLDRWPGDDLEREVLPALAAEDQLYAFDHDGFWKSMDTYKESLDLTELCRGGDPPWLDAPGTARTG